MLHDRSRPGLQIARALLLILLAGCAGTREAQPNMDSSPATAVAGWTDSRGGAGGRIVRVTTLAASGRGSFAEAVAAEGPRVVVFEVGGVVDLAGEVVVLDSPYITVAGQTAPSPGITFVGGGIRIDTHDVIIQHIRIRPGDRGGAKRSGWEIDGLATWAGARDVVIDHVSATWATDENISPSGPRFADSTSMDPAVWRAATAHRITLSNNIVAEGLSESTHAKGEHSKGTLVHDNVTGVLIYGNLYASNVDRNPLFKGGAEGAVVNNLIHNPGSRAMSYNLSASEWRGFPHQVGKMAVVGNVVRAGLDTRADMALLRMSGVGELLLYLEDNIATDRSGRPLPRVAGSPTESGAEARLVGEPPVWPDGLRTLPSSEVEGYVLANAGARPWDRDLVDQRIIRAVREGTGRIIDSERQVGGQPAIPATRRAFDPAAWNLETMQPKSRRSNR